MLSPPRREPDYAPRFNAVFPALSKQRGVLLYRFFLQGAFGDPRLMQSVGKHPNAYGADVIAARMTPMVERELRVMDRPKGLSRAAR